MLSETEVQQKIAEIEKQKQDLIMQANSQASYLQGQIDLLRSLLQPKEKVETLKK